MMQKTTSAEVKVRSEEIMRGLKVIRREMDRGGAMDGEAAVVRIGDLLHGQLQIVLFRQALWAFPAAAFFFVRCRSSRSERERSKAVTPGLFTSALPKNTQQSTCNS